MAFHEFTIPIDLIKGAKIKKLKMPVYGHWEGLKIIAYGPKGGKIVGYNSHGKPIYAGSQQAYKLAAMAKQKKETPNYHGDVTAEIAAVAAWLKELGIDGDVVGDWVHVSNAAGKVLQAAFDVPFSEGSGLYSKIPLISLSKHVGQPLKLKEDDEIIWAAKVAAGADDDPVFPDLAKLEEIEAGAFAGSHGNKLFKDGKGKRWVFKSANPTIARAEEAACRIGRLILGDRVPRAQYVQISGKDGTLIEVLDGKILSDEHSSPPVSSLKKFAADLIQHEIVDWLVSNHDAHAGNFVVQGNKLAAIDKGQAWKWVGEDKLDPTYHGSNPSKVVYQPFWEKVAGGLKTEIVAAAAEALDSAEQITPEQFRAIILPYVATFAGWKTDLDSDALIEKMVGRLNTLRTDIEGLLSEQFEGSVTIPKKAVSADNFETMPESKPGKPVLTIAEPGKPVAIQPGAAQPVVSPVPGWPLTKGSGKGKTTVYSPGGIPPPGWKTGVPGPGFTAAVLYKKKEFQLEILQDADGKPSWKVTFPDGSEKTTHSGNIAGDWLYLFDQLLSLDMSAGEKKAQKISLGTKVFKLDQFAEDLAASYGQPLVPTQQTVQALEEQKLVEPAQKALTTNDLLAQKPDGLINDWTLLPADVADYLMGQTSHDVDEDWPGKMPPGYVVKITAKDGSGMMLATPIMTATATGLKLKYQVWEQKGAEWAPLGLVTQAVLEDDPLFDSLVMAELLKLHKKVGATPSAGEPPDVAVAPDAAGGTPEIQVPAAAPKVFAGPLAPGVVIKQKLVHEGKKITLELEVSEDPEAKNPYFVRIDGAFVGSAKTISEAASVAMAKIGISGQPAGWKLFGINAEMPAEEPEPVIPALAPPPPEPGPAAPGEANWETMPETDKDEIQTKILSFPVGTKIKIKSPGGKDNIFSKTAVGWVFEGKLFGWEGPQDSMKMAGIVNLVTPTPGSTEVLLPAGFEPEPEPEPGKLNWDNFPIGVILPTDSAEVDLELLASAPLGSSVMVGDLGDVKVYEKYAGGWYSGTEFFTNDKILEFVKSVSGVKFVRGQAYKAKPETWDQIKTPNLFTVDVKVSGGSAFFEKAPDNTRVLLRVPNGLIMAHKIPGTKKWKYDFSENSQNFSEEVEVGSESSSYAITLLANSALVVQVQKEDAPAPEPALEPAPEAVAPAPAPTLFKPISSKEELPIPVQNLYSNMIANIGPAEENVPGSTKPSKNWPSWVPPPGLMLEMKYNDKRYFVVCHSYGAKKEDGEIVPSDELNFVVINENGAFFQAAAVPLSLSDHLPGDILVMAAQKAGIQASGMELLQLLGLSGDHPGFTTSDTAASVLAAQPPAVFPSPSGKTAAEMTPAEKVKLVKQTVAVQTAIKLHPKIKESGGTLKIKPAKAGSFGDSHYVCLDGIDGSKAAEILESVAQELGFAGQIKTFGGKPKINQQGAFITIPTEVLGWSATILQPAAEAASTPKAPSADNWETMPEGFTQPVADATEAALMMMPVGTTVWAISGNYGWQKTPGGWKTVGPGVSEQYGLTADGISNSMSIGNSISNTTYQVYPPGQDPTAVPLAPEKPKKAKVPKKPKVTAAAKALKKLQKWASENPAVSDSAALFVLGHMAQAWEKSSGAPGSGEIYARQGEGGKVLLGHKSSEKTFQNFLEQLGMPVEWVETPLGKMALVDPQQLAGALPGKPASTIVGPDGKTYPAGTEFNKKEIPFKTKDLVAAEGYKIKDHDKIPELAVLKVSGTGPDQLAQLKAVIAKYGLTGPYPEPKETGNGFLFFTPKADLEKVHHTDTQLEVIHPPVPEFIAAGLATGESTVGSDASESGPHELALLSGMKLPAFGHAILMGDGGIFRDYQVCCRRVKGKDGKFYHEVSGQLSNFKSEGTSLPYNSNVPLPSAMTKVLSSGHKTLGHFDDHTLETAESGLIAAYSGYMGSVGSGTQVRVFAKDENSSPTFGGTFAIRIPEGADMETELAAAFDSLGVDSKKALAPADLEKYKKFSVVRALMGPMGWNHALLNPDDMTNDSWLDSKITELKGKALLKNVSVRRTFDGTISCVADDGDRFKKAGWKCAYRTDSSIYSIFYQILGGAGWASRKQKYLMGSSTGGQSASSDLISGGANGEFFRIGSEYFSGENRAIVFHPRVFERLDWWRFKGDQYGSIVPNSSGSPHSGVMRSNTDIGSNSNEIMFQGGLPLSDIMAIAVNAPEERTKLLSMLAAEGVTHIGAVPLDKIIVSGAYSTNFKDFIAQLPPEVKP